MAPSLFEQLRRCFKPQELAPVIFESFSNREIVRLMTSAEIVYPGVRMELDIVHADEFIALGEDVLRPAV